MSSEQQTQQADDPRDDRYWRNVLPSEILQPDDMMRTMTGLWLRTTVPGRLAREGCGGTYRRRIEQQPEAQPQTQAADDPSGPGWRWVERNEVLRDDDMQQGSAGIWRANRHAGKPAIDNRTYRRRIEQLQQAETNPDDPSGDGWRDLGPKEPIEQGDVFIDPGGGWMESDAIGRTPSKFPNLRHRRRIEPQQPSDSEPETIEDLRRQLAACEMLLAEAGGSGEQVNAELQQLREQVATSQHLAEMSRRQVADEAGKVEQLKEQVQTLTRALKTERDSMIGNLRSQNRLGQEAAVELIEAWLRPVVELMAEQPEDHAELAIVILGYLPQIASRLIEE